MRESSTSPSNEHMTRFSFSLRELLMLILIASLVCYYFVRPSNQDNRNPNALFSLSSPIEYRYWHQIGPKGSGTGQIGSGSEWQSANGIEVFENFIILYSDNGFYRMVEREGLQWFDWRKTDGTGSKRMAAGPIHGSQ